MLKKLEGMAPAPYPIQNKVKSMDEYCYHSSSAAIKVESEK